MPLSDGQYLILTDDEWLLLSDEDFIISSGILSGVLDGDTYQSIAVSYGNARSQILGSKQFLFDAVYLIVLIDETQPEVDLLSTFWDTYNINTDSLNAPTLMLSSVRAINQHVISKGGYESIDEYLLVNGVMVPQEWAEMSEAAGFEISEEYWI